MILSSLLDFVFPPRCVCCGMVVAQANGVCATCWRALTFIEQPMCVTCGAPLEHGGAGHDTADSACGDQLCGACVASPSLVARSRSALVYDDASRPLILAFKHADRTGVTATLAGWMCRAARDELARAELLIPVPLHRWRLFARRYNQAAMLALAVGRLVGKPVLVDGLTRVRATPSQGHKRRRERRANVTGAFKVPVSRQALIAGRRVALVDDVRTTGATLESCARALLAAGASAVDAVTLARAPWR